LSARASPEGAADSVPLKHVNHLTDDIFTFLLDSVQLH
jgi:hypothetical protein